MHEPKIYIDQVTLDQKKESKTIFFSSFGARALGQHVLLWLHGNAYYN